VSDYKTKNSSKLSNLKMITIP